jgi:GNAT superfamily N-acetyltransferase
LRYDPWLFCEDERVIEIVLLHVDQWREWRVLRLAALKESADSFGSTFEEWSGTSDTEQRWRGYFAERGVNIVAKLDGERVGLVRAAPAVQGSMVELTSLWVDPCARGFGIGSALIAAVSRWMSATFPDYTLRLSVKKTNIAARTLYAKESFIEIGPDPEDPTEIVMSS